MTRASETAMERLPKWARDEIARLTADIGYYKERLDSLLNEDGSPISYGYDCNGGSFGRIPDDTIHFDLSENGIIDIKIVDGELLLTARSGRMTLRPQAGNAISVLGRRDGE